jgi:small-conductance mechanosensitive channel
MTWWDFLEPTIAKIVLTILIVAILCYVYLTLFLTWPLWRWVVGIIFWYLMSCLIVFAFKGFKQKKILVRG